MNFDKAFEKFKQFIRKPDITAFYDADEMRNYWDAGQCDKMPSEIRLI